MKKFTKLALLLLLVASVFTLAACDDNPASQPASGEICVKEDGMPQTLFVLGEELDLSNGVLTVTEDGQTQQMPLNAEGITISGYDKNKLGEQTITITYGGHSTQLTVTVVDRMQAVEYTTDYLVGDAFDADSGRLKITRNDGSSYTVILSNSAVTVTGFDAGKAADQTLTATYNDGTNTYECKFTVHVHAVDSVEFHAPSKLSYESHETGVDLTGGYFTLTGNGGKLTKNVAVTEDMLDGFDLNAVTAENSPLTQKVTVTYNGQSYQYDIQLTYTAISFFQKEAAAFAGLDWSGVDLPEIDPALGQLALELMEAYLELSKADQTYIPHEDALNVARTALTYGLELMEPELVALEGAVIISNGIEFTCQTREGVEAAIEVLDNDDSVIYSLSPLLISLIENFEDEEILYAWYFGDIYLMPAELYEELLDAFEHMLDFHDVLMEIPEDWQTAGVETYEAEILDLYNVIFSNDYAEGGMAYLYSYVSAWRENNDAFDILYTYFYGQGDAETMITLAEVALPEKLDAILYNALEMMDQVDMISNYAQKDTTLLMYYYHSAIELAEEVKNGDDVMMKYLYEILPINSLMGLDDSTLLYFDTLLEYIRTMEGGYYQYSGGLLGVDEYHVLMASYMRLINNMWEDSEYETSEQYGKDLEALFALFVDLKPTQQYYFLNTLNAFYSMSVPPMAFDDSGDMAELMCFFVTLVHEYYRDKLSDDAVSAYNDLVLAIEIYAQRMNRENWKAEFTEKMDSVQAAYAKMNADDKAAFDQYLGAIYDKYADIRDTYVLADDLIDLGDWEDEFQALDEAVLNVEVALTYIQKGQPLYALFFNAYERAQRLADYILTNAPAEIVEAYYYEARYGANDAENGMGTDSVVTTYEYVMTTYRNMYVNYLLSALGYSVYDVYVGSALPGFMDACYDLNWPYLYGDAFDQTQVMSILKDFREMTLEEQILFVLLEGSSSCYYLALDQFVTVSYSAETAAVAMKLLELEQQYIIYSYTQSEDSLLLLKTMEAELVSLYEALSAEDKAAFADWQEMYDYYMGQCQLLPEPAPAAA